MCCGTDENVSADDRKGMILQAQGKGVFKIAQNPSKMPQIAQERAWEYKYTPCTKTPEIPRTVHTHSVVFLHCLYFR